MTTQALGLHPENPHYFMLKGKPEILITSAEHYGSILNLEFDYRKYLSTLYKEGLNHTRIFAGVYREFPGEWFPNNSLGIKPEQFACPFARSSVPGAADGGNKFDLNHWNDIFFERLKDFCHIAGEYGIVVEVNLFCPYYIFMKEGEEYLDRWNASPWHPDNNVNNLEEVLPREIFTLKSKLLSYQEKMVKKIVTELNSYENLYYEICNEAYFDGVTLEWQIYMANAIARTEKELPLKHLISRNAANGTLKLDEKENTVFSIFNFHYTRTADALCVSDNFDLRRVIGCNETGFHGTDNEYYRVEAWQFILSGGGLYNNLDASFYPGNEDGAVLPEGTEHFGGGAVFRKQLRVLKDFIESFEFIRMKPDHKTITDCAGASDVRVLAEQGRQYGIYIYCHEDAKCSSIRISVPDGLYTVQFINTISGRATELKTIIAQRGCLEITLPVFECDTAVRILGSHGE